MAEQMANALVPVEQTDREAALAYYLYTRSLPATDYRAEEATKRFASGAADETETVQAFARHRLATVIETTEAAARLADAECGKYLPGGPVDMKRIWQFHAAGLRRGDHLKEQT